MDKPTSTLTDHEVKQLFTFIRRLKEKGISIIYVSCKIEKIFEICDTITVLRDRKYIDTVKKENTSSDEIIRMLIGRSLNTMSPPHTSKLKELLLSVR